MFYDQTPPSAIDLKPVHRTTEEQARINEQTSEMALYHYDGCFFSARVRKTIEILNLQIELRDILTNPEHGEDLMKNGGSITVPCLHYRHLHDSKPKWMYESVDIIAYLTERFQR